MDLLTPTDEQQELSARALRACLAAEAALASLRAECLPLQSTLPRLGEAGNRNLELAHRSLQLQIEACESFTLCATAAFKQLCDAHFLPTGKKGIAAKLAQVNSTPTVQPGCSPYTRKFEEEYRMTKSKLDPGIGNSTTNIQTQEEAPAIFGNSLGSQMSSDSEEAPRASQQPACPNPPKTSSSLASSNQKALKEFGRRLEPSDHRTPEHVSGKPDITTPAKSSSQVKSTPTFLTSMKESYISPFTMFEPKETNIAPCDSLACSPDTNCAIRSAPAPSDLCSKPAIGSTLQLSATELASTRYLPSHIDSALRRDPSKGNEFTFKPASNQGTDPASQNNNRGARSKSVCHSRPTSASQQSRLPQHTTEVSTSCGSILPLPSSQFYKCFDAPSSETAQFPYVESPAASMGCRNLIGHDMSLPPSVATGILGKPMTPPLTGSQTGPRSYSVNSTLPMTSQTNEANEPLLYNKNGHFLHTISNSNPCASSSHSGLVKNVEQSDLDKAQTRRSCSHGSLGNHVSQEPSSTPVGFAAPKGGRAYLTQSTSLSRQTSQSASFDIPNPSYRKPGPPRGTSNAGCGQPPWTVPTFPSEAVTYHMWPYTQLSEGGSKSTAEQSRFASSSFAEAPPLKSITQAMMPEGIHSMDPEGSSLTSQNDLKNWQVVTRLDAEFQDNNFRAIKSSYCKGTKAHLRDNFAGDEGSKATDSSKKWYEVFGTANQPQCRERDVVELDSEDEMEDDSQSVLANLQG